MNGFRQQAQGGRKERLRQMETESKNAQMSMRITQQLVRQLMQNGQNMSQDLGKAFGLINDLQYKVLAMQKLSNLDTNVISSEVETMRLNDFIDASDKEDKDQNFTIGTIIDENSTVILTSIVQGKADGGIFRSRIKLAECGVPDLIKAFIGKAVGAKAIVKLNGDDHEIEILGVRQPPPPAPVEEVKTPEAVPAEVVTT